jgi:folate-binding Fe-S cluster repair protein YgfZ
MDESEKKMTDPYPKSWFQMYNEERQKNEDLETVYSESGIAFDDLKREKIELESRLAEAEKVIDAIWDTFNHQFGIGWIEEKFQASIYEIGDSINTCDEVGKLLRELFLRGRG